MVDNRWRRLNEFLLRQAVRLGAHGLTKRQLWSFAASDDGTLTITFHGMHWSSTEREFRRCIRAVHESRDLSWEDLFSVAFSVAHCRHAARTLNLIPLPLRKIAPSPN